jgi:hypothetical protein
MPLLSPSRGTKAGTTAALSMLNFIRSTPISSLMLERDMAAQIDHRQVNNERLRDVLRVISIKISK